MGRNNLVKSKTLYNIKERHKVTKDSVIYENDLVTILPGRGETDYDSVVYPNSIFQYRIKSNKNSKKKHHRGEFIKPSVQIENESEYVWSLENLGSGVTLSSESKIIHKPNYSSLKDFAYYGSAVELIKATVNDVIMRFPGGLSYYNENPPIINVCGVKYYEISNEFEIDCWTTGVIPYENIKNPMRVLAASYDKYVLGDGAQCSSPKFIPNKSTSYNSIIGTTNFGAGNFSVYLDANGKHKLLTTQKGQGVILKPKQEYIDKFWDELDDFERVLLNRDTSPVYKAVFETPFITENGHFYTNKSYIWPTINNDGITPDLSTEAFNGYLQSLLTLATYHDKYDSDNLWRMMTHESIKHLDWTFTDKNNRESEEDFESSGMEAMIRIYGRQFDDIKRYADGIKSMNVLSYDGKNNVPDYFLSDKVEEDGWLAKHVSRFENILTDSIKCENNSNVIIYPKDKNGSYVNNVFQSRLALSSNYIQSMKGTRRGIETILGMFGYEEDENLSNAGTFKIDEYVFLVTSALSYSVTSFFRNAGENVTELIDIPHYLYDFPVALISCENNNDDYLIPWFSNKETYKFPMYFQSKGGWGKRNECEVHNFDLTQVETIESNGNLSIYSETQSYMKFADNFNDLLSFSYSDVFENMVCYVTDISNIGNVYTPYDGETNDYSHYFVLKNVLLLQRCGFVQNEIYNCYGWYNVKISELFNCETDDAKRVVYLESLISKNSGNNPHIGNGLYDNGESYIENFTDFFKDFRENGYFELLDTEIYTFNEEIQKKYESIKDGSFGFKYDENSGEIIDNKKCAYFHDYIVNNKPWTGDTESNNGSSSGKTKTNNESSSGSTESNDDSSYSWNSEPYKGVEFPDTPISDIDDIADESQANAIINLKKLVITFGTGNNKYLKDYILNVVLTYLEEMIPATTILEYRFDSDNVNNAVNTNFYPEGSYTVLEAAHAMAKNNESVINWREYPNGIIPN